MQKNGWEIKGGIPRLSSCILVLGVRIPYNKVWKKMLSKSNNICFIEKVLKRTNIMGLHSQNKIIIGKTCLFQKS
jgi:hypothetical protein